ncbi:hypothetical protein NDU88_007040 [Pleurodeles waltl]|uniref:Uncharacterized protein n=1 Tax=Pleurodeles waltl TaxID=8319 RepID=A0AAV7WCB1_PLEWA|nr:hypothetical protein NDU88_007040 [Pleurodeles waltl]
MFPVAPRRVHHSSCSLQKALFITSRGARGRRKARKETTSLELFGCKTTSHRGNKARPARAGEYTGYRRRRYSECMCSTRGNAGNQRFEANRGGVQAPGMMKPWGKALRGQNRIFGRWV